MSKLGLEELRIKNVAKIENINTIVHLFPPGMFKKNHMARSDVMTSWSIDITLGYFL